MGSRYGVATEVPRNAILARNIGQLTESLQSQPRYFYGLYAIDMTNKKYRNSKFYEEAVKRFAPFIGKSYELGVTINLQRCSQRCSGSIRAMLRDDSVMRRQIGALITAGLKTKTLPLPETHVEFGRLLAKVRELAPGDLKAKLQLTGFVDKPHGPDQMRCQECMYYLVHSQWCDLPELAIPVEPDWWCRLWRI